jgi:hypothetical protein
LALHYSKLDNVWLFDEECDSRSDFDDFEEALEKFDPNCARPYSGLNPAFAGNPYNYYPTSQGSNGFGVFGMGFMNPSA